MRETCESVLDEYGYKIIADNNIEGVLRHDLKVIDNRFYLEYECRGKKNLKRILSGRNVQGDDIRLLIKSLMELQSRLEEYLMGVDDISLNPEDIFVGDIYKGDYSFCYIPENEREDFGLSDLAGFLVEKVDYADKSAVVLAYGLMGISERKESLSLQMDSLKELLKTAGADDYDAFDDETGEDEPKKDTNFNYDRKSFSERIKDKVISAAKDKILKRFDRNIFKRKSRSFSKRENVETSVKPERCYPDDEETVLMPGTQEEEKTVLLERNSVISFLWSEGIIEVKKLPAVIGSSNNSDVRIDIPQISRKHVRVYENGSDVLVEDLKSLNGTYLNGRRLAPFECAIIKGGDVLTLSHVDFTAEI